MTQTTKEILQNYQIRKTKKQKSAFRDYVTEVAKSNGYDVKIEKGSMGVQNIVIGDPDTAKVLYTAHYDTCARCPFPNFITPKNFTVYLLYQFLIVGVFFAVALGLSFGIHYLVSLTPASDKALSIIARYLPQVIIWTMLYILTCGPANQNTANDNTSGVTTVLDIMQQLPQEERSKVAFVLFDLEESGLFGSSSFVSKHKSVKKNTLVLNFDCVSDGENMLFALKKSTRQYEDLLAKAFVSTPQVNGDIAKKAFYPSDNASFKGGIGVAALKKAKFRGMLYMDRIHTKKDVIYREENIQFLTEGAIKLAQML